MPCKKVKDRIAIVGMSGRFPKARNIKEYWENLCFGKDGISRGFDQKGKGSNYVNARGILDDISLFDADFFGMNHREAKVTEPQHRVFLECCYEALDDAGYSPKYFSGSIGVYGCAGPNRYYYTNILPHAEYRDALDDPIVRIGNDHDYLTTRVSYKLNLKGPSLAIQTACSSSLASICVACNQLRTGECDIALAGGASIFTPQNEGYFFQMGMIYSPDGVCRPFDAKAQGTVPGSGAGVIALKRLEDAIKDKDHIYAIIRGHRINNDGSEKLGFSAPSAKGQTKGIIATIDMADVEADTVGYVEAHGTGTVLGDPIEVQALTHAFRHYTEEKEFCGIGSVKSNIGHLMETSGVAGLIKASLALYNEMIPPTIHFDTSNPHISFKESPFYPVTELKAWKKGKKPRRALVNALGFGGTNAYVLLEEAPVIPEKHLHRENLFVFSAKTPSALQKILDQFPKEGLPLEDAAFTLQVGRTPYSHRAAFIASDSKSLASQMESFTYESPEEPPPTAFFFPDLPRDWEQLDLSLYLSDEDFFQDLENCAFEGETITGIDFRVHLKSMGSQPKTVQKIAHFSILYCLKRWFEKLGLQPETLSGMGIGHFLTLDGTFREQLIEALKTPAPESEIPPKALVITPLNYHELLSVLKKLWLEGKEIHWPLLYKHHQPRRIPLPSYPFERKYHWVEPPLEKKEEKAPVKTSQPLSLEENLMAIWKKGLAVESVSVVHDFSELGGDSLLAVQLVSKIKEALGISLPPNTILQYPTIKKLSNWIQNQKTAQHFVTLKEGDQTLPPLFVFHQIDGHTISYQELANALNYAGKVIGLESQFSLDTPDCRLEEVATRYVQTLQKIEPKGPYSLMGTSFGGLLAFEVAQQLRQKGKDVHLTMVDIINPQFLLSAEMYETLRELFSEGVPLPQTSDKKTQTAVLMKQMGFESLSDTEQERMFDLMQIHWNAFIHYQPKPYDGHVVFLEGEGHPKPLHATWSSIIPHLHASTINGSHLGLMKRPYVKKISAVLENSYATV
ncbi:MAG: hypothetical protein KDK64_07685 [Chlamydiia bacterium]|nr:hypothetical protein [Chlamydiia bacterium]